VVTESQVRGLWLIPFFVISVVFVNFSSSALNNLSVAFLEAAFCIATILYVGLGHFKVRSLGFAVVFVCVVLLLCNWLAELDGVTPASWWRVLGVVAHLFFALLIARWFVLTPRTVHWLVGAMLLSVGVYFAVVVELWNALDEPQGYNWVSDPPLFRNIRHVGYFLCIGAVVASWAIFYYSGWRQFGAWLIYVIGVGLLLWTGGRGGALGYLFGTVILAVRFSPKEYFVQWISHLFALILALWGSAVFVVNQRAMGWISVFFQSITASSIDELSSSRIAIWIFLAEKIVERPWFGWGGEGFRAVWPESGLFQDQGLVQAHNGLLQLLIEWGILGTLCMCLLLGWIFVKGTWCYLRAGIRADKTLSLGVPLVFALLALACVDGVFYHGTPFAFLMIGFGMIIASVGGDNTQSL
jgi:O-antigen ligase